MNGAIIGVFLVIIAYLVMMLAIGFFYSKGNNDSSDFYLGGRKLGPFVTAMSAEASDMSSWLLMGLPGVAYLSGTCDAAWTSDRTRDRYLFKLADRRKETQKIQCEDKFDHDAGFLFEPVPR